MGAIVIIRTGDRCDNRMRLGRAFLAGASALYSQAPRIIGMATVPGGV